MDRQLAQRLKSKSVKNAIIGQISEAFNLTPLLAEAYFNQIKGYFLEHADISLDSGQLHYLAIDDREAAGKPVDYDVSYPPGLFVLIFKSQKGGLFDGETSSEIGSR